MINALLFMIEESQDIFDRLIIVSRSEGVADEIVELPAFPDGQGIDNALQLEDMVRQNPRLDFRGRPFAHGQGCDVSREFANTEAPQNPMFRPFSIRSPVFGFQNDVLFLNVFTFNSNGRVKIDQVVEEVHRVRASPFQTILMRGQAQIEVWVPSVQSQL